MPRKKTAQIGVVVPIQPPEEEEETATQTMEREEVEDALAQATEAAADVPSRTYVRLYRTHPQHGNRESLTDSFDADLFSQDYVRDTYGGGHYRAQFMGPRKVKGGKVGTGPIKEVRFDIDLTIPAKHPKAVTGAVSSGTGNDTPGTRRIDAALEGGVLALLEGFQNMNAAQVKMLESMTTRPQTNWAPVLAAVVPGVVTLLTALLGNRKDPIESAREIAALTTGDKKSTAGMVGELRDMILLVEQLKGNKPLPTGDDDSEESSWLRIIEKAGVPLLQAALQQPQAPVSQVAPAATRPQLPTAPPQQSIAPQPDMPAELLLLRPFLPSIQQWAMQGRDPDWAAETLLYEVPAGFHAMLRTKLEDATIISQLVHSAPALAPFVAWLETLRLALLEATLPDEEEPSPE